MWRHAELSLREWKSSLAHARLLKDNGFTVEWGAAGFPTAFVATYGTEGPALGFNAEYDAPACRRRRVWAATTRWSTTTTLTARLTVPVTATPTTPWGRAAPPPGDPRGRPEGPEAVRQRR
ncbi:hypothetical protein [Streptomyces sp. NPDC002172]